MDIIIFDFSVKSLFWLISSVKENLPNNSAHLNMEFFTSSLHGQLYLTYKCLNTKLIVVIKIDVVWNCGKMCLKKKKKV